MWFRPEHCSQHHSCLLPRVPHTRVTQGQSCMPFRIRYRRGQLQRQGPGAPTGCKVTFFLHLVTTEIASFTAHTLPIPLHPPKGEETFLPLLIPAIAEEWLTSPKTFSSLTRVHNLGGTFLSSTFYSQQKLHIK